MRVPKPLRLPADTIVTHDRRWPTLPMRELVAHCWRRGGINKRPPPTSEVAGSVAAELEHGRWIVKCPNRPVGCGGALNASLTEPVFLCADCGSPENGGKWYAVVFPPDRAAIEAMLLRRPAVLADSAINRNWIPGESLGDLRRENAEHGITP